MTLHPEGIEQRELRTLNAVLSTIELDASIQCRADIDIATVNEYAEAMRGGAEFPPVDLFGTAEKCWIGDGWHRVMAARQLGLADIEATLHSGGRVEALRHALGANALHGHRRSNADKHRTVEIALREFEGLSNVVIAKMCGVSDPFVMGLRPPEPLTVRGSTRMGADGKERPAHREAQPKEEEVYREEERPVFKLGPPCIGMQYARMAIMDLEQIRGDDLEREEAFDRVQGWLDEHR